MNATLEGEPTPLTARGLLTYAVDGADALMAALLMGCGDPRHALDLLLASMDGPGSTAPAELDRCFRQGVQAWGQTAGPHGMQSFHRACGRWRARLAGLPSRRCDTLAAWITDDGRYWMAGPGDPAWPVGLDDLAVKADWAPPLCLWGLGNMGALTACDAPVAVVGSRGVTPYGRQVAATVASAVAAQGHTVVSGGAMGTDAAAHWGAVHACERLGAGHAGVTVAVFAGGLRHVGPASNARLFDAMLASHGALVSECHPDTVPVARRFLLRNRLIAAMARTVIVAQARIRSGALNTAHWANDLNRLVGAVPGPVTTPDHAGCHELIRNQEALLLADPHDVAEWTHGPHVPGGTAAPGPSLPGTADGTAACIPQEARPLLGIVHAMAARDTTPTVGAVCNEACRTHPGAFPDTACVMGMLGLLEMAGAITSTGGVIVVKDPRASC